MAGLVPAIHAKPLRNRMKASAIDGFDLAIGATVASVPHQISKTPRRPGVDGRDKPGHDVAGARATRAGGALVASAAGGGFRI
ncbi:hypothetical protein A1351_11895 [Methylosinus sp. R-45379]|nr:hypothetical protein A1351_11895 [Methylosinus sp. R-45379]